MAKTNYERLNAQEKQWIDEYLKKHGFTIDDVNKSPMDATISILWGEYAARGFILHDANDMVKRLSNQEET